jgi:hypothetical protein
MRPAVLTLSLISLLALAACSPSPMGLIEVSGYDAQGTRTGSMLPALNTLTPY